jgi:hypothetical protein
MVLLTINFKWFENNIFSKEIMYNSRKLYNVTFFAHNNSNKLVVGLIIMG